MVATSVMELGASRQMAQVKSSGGFCAMPVAEAAEEDATATRDLAAGFKSISSISSSSSTMGVSFVPCAPRGGLLLTGEDAAVRLVLLLPLDRSVAVVVARAKRVKRRCGAKSSVIRRDASRAALRVDRLMGTAAGVVESVVPTEKDGTVVASEVLIMIIICSRFTGVGSPELSPNRGAGEGEGRF